MAIEFACSGCGKKMRAPDQAGGRQAKCPLCGALQTIPVDPPEGIFPAIGPADTPTSQPLSSPQQPSSQPSPSETVSGGAAVPTLPGSSLTIDCLKAIRYGVSNFKSIFILVLYAVGVFMFLQLIAIFIPILGTVVAAAANIMVGGLFLRFYLDAVISSLEGVDQAPGVPEFNLREMFANGVKGLGVLFVYILPVLTIPLLPLGLLALAYSDDVRAYDVTWAVRAAMRKPVQLLILWPFLLLWLAVMFVASALLWTLLAAVFAAVASDGYLSLLAGLVILAAGAAVIAAVGVMFITILFRCIGMLGRHNPELMEMLPDQPQPVKSAIFIAAGVVVSLLMLYYVIGPALEQLPEA